MSELLDATNGKVEWIDCDEDTGDIRITTVQDVNPLLDALKAKRNENHWQKEIKEDFVHFCTIPEAVELELLNKGISLYDKNATKRLMQEIQTNYPYLLAHDGKRF